MILIETFPQLIKATTNTKAFLPIPRKGGVLPNLNGCKSRRKRTKKRSRKR